MAFPAYTPTPTKLVTLARADGSELLAAATTNVSLEQLADGIAYIQGRGYIVSTLWKRDEDDGGLTTWTFNSLTYAANSTTPSDWSVTIPDIVSGDIIHVDVAFYMRAPANTTGTVRIGVKHGAAAEYMAPGTRQLGGTATDSVDHAISMHSRAVATGAGSTTVRVLGKYSGAGGNVLFIAYGELRVTVLRTM